MATPNYGLPTFTGSEQYSLKTVANQITNATDDALKVVSKGGTPRVADASARATLFPAPIQGDSVFRKNVGWEEVYYETYNATTNPAGTGSAGWYPIAGKLPYAFAYRPTAAAITSTPSPFTFTTTGSYSATVSTTAVTITQPGRYSCSASIVAGNGGSAMVFGELRKNDAAFPQISGFGAASQANSNDYNSLAVSGNGNFAAGDTIKFYVWGSTSLTTGNLNARMDVQYIGPA